MARQNVVNGLGRTPRRAQLLREALRREHLGADAGHAERPRDLPARIDAIHAAAREPSEQIRGEAPRVVVEEQREVFNTGAEVSFKASRTWAGAKSKFWEINGVRHIVMPSVNYAYVPNPSIDPSRLPQFDYELPSAELLPLMRRVPTFTLVAPV